MDRSVLFVVDNDRLHHFVSRDELGADVVAVLQSDLGVTVGETVLPIAHWDHDRTGPLSVALNFSGELVILVMAETFTDQAILLNTLSTLEQWLAPMDLRDLGELSGDPNKFVQGLWELSPRTPLALASMLRVLLINPVIDLDTDAFSSSLPFSRVEELRIEALEAADGTVTIRRAHHVSDELGATLPLQDSSPITINLAPELDEPVVTVEDPDDQVIVDFSDGRLVTEIHLADDVDDIFADTPIDLTVEDEHGPKDSASKERATKDSGTTEVSDTDISIADDSERPTVIRGSHYVTAELPLYFDPTGANIESISDELFAVGPHLILVIDLDQRDETPLETASIFRWDSEPGHSELFELNEFDRERRRRTVHVFVESGAQPNRVFYLGTADQLAKSDRSEHGAMWFKLRDPVDARILSPLQARTLPVSSLDGASTPTTASPTSTPTTASSATSSPAPDQTGNWVPNV